MAHSVTTEAREKISRDFKSIEFWENFDVCLTKFRNNHFFLKIK